VLTTIYRERSDGKRDNPIRITGARPGLLTCDRLGNLGGWRDGDQGAAMGQSITQTLPDEQLVLDARLLPADTGDGC
jgi:hypothetical protein